MGVPARAGSRNCDRPASIARVHNRACGTRRRGEGGVLAGVWGGRGAAAAPTRSSGARRRRGPASEGQWGPWSQRSPADLHGPPPGIVADSPVQKQPARGGGGPPAEGFGARRHQIVCPRLHRRTRRWIEGASWGLRFRPSCVAPAAEVRACAGDGVGGAEGRVCERVCWSWSASAHLAV